MIEHPFPQGSPEWIEARRGVITASRAKDARDFKRNGDPSEKRITYAMDLARERCGGKAAAAWQNSAMRTGSEEEPFAAIAYVAETGEQISEAIFVTTDDRKFGVSLDRKLDNKRAALEIKTMVSSATLFKAVVDGDISEYRDQCVFAMWVLVLDWIDLCLWAPDLPEPLFVVRIVRDEDEIQKMEDDMLAFDRLVEQYRLKLEARMKRASVNNFPPPWSEPTPAHSPLPVQSTPITEDLLAF